MEKTTEGSDLDNLVLKVMNIDQKLPFFLLLKIILKNMSLLMKN